MSDIPEPDKPRSESLHAATGTSVGIATSDDATAKGLPTRPLGKTGVNVSIISLGGWHIGDVKDHQEAIKIMHTALDERKRSWAGPWRPTVGNGGRSAS
jgi:hypothetical protein